MTRVCLLARICFNGCELTEQCRQDNEKDVSAKNRLPDLERKNPAV
jgi:hypothetical protein